MSNNDVSGVLLYVEFPVSVEDADFVEELLLGQQLNPEIIIPCDEPGPARFRIYGQSLEEVADVSARLRCLFTESWNEMLSTPVVTFIEGEMKREDWAECWKEHFKPLAIGERLLIKPSWAPADPESQRLIIELDPGMSFGTGQHGTTQACLEFIEEISRFAEDKELSLLDAGCGSGILAMAAAAIGFNPITAFDNQPETVKIARYNIENSPSNGMIEILCTELENFSSVRKYNLVVANILAPILIKNAVKLTDLLASDGKSPPYLVLSGILDSQYPEVRDKFLTLGLREYRTKLINEWRSGCFMAE